MQFQRVSIPSVGTIKLVQQPATLDIASKLIHPPIYAVAFSDDDAVSEHQLNYFQSELHADVEGTHYFLSNLGQELKQRIQADGYEWKGIGRLEYNNNAVLFHPHNIVSGLQPVAADRVLREHVQHSVLVGDHVVLSDANTDVFATETSKRNYPVIIGWALAIIAVLFILFYLFQNNFSVTSSGLQKKIETESAPPTYK